ncbi:MAG: endonuclease/exonuclease/phosphatase family protein [Chloroflexota bacterium]|nr:endonuclease/exonuclease/phosphatase family protein [Chloroflexota bacterium]
MASTLRILTLNILNFADRWPQRLPLLLADFAAVQPDLAGIQEVVHVMEQDRVLAAAGPRRYGVRRAYTHAPEVGNSILVADPLATRLRPPDETADRLDLKLGRCAHRAEVEVDGRRIRVVNTHLHHLAPDHAQREEQVERLIEWIAALEPVDATVVTGDFNALPGSGVYRRMQVAGYRSAYAEANGQEPEATWPSGLVGAATAVDGAWSGCLDYIWFAGALEVRSARLSFDRPAVNDPTLFPSDHRAVVAEMEVLP